MLLLAFLHSQGYRVTFAFHEEDEYYSATAERKGRTHLGRSRRRGTTEEAFEDLLRCMLRNLALAHDDEDLRKTLEEDGLPH